MHTHLPTCLANLLLVNLRRTWFLHRTRIFMGAERGTAIIFKLGCGKPQAHCVAGTCWLLTCMTKRPSELQQTNDRRERERERDRYIHIYIYTYISRSFYYIYTYAHTMYHIGTLTLWVSSDRVAQPDSKQCLMMVLGFCSGCFWCSRAKTKRRL